MFDIEARPAVRHWQPYFGACVLLCGAALFAGGFRFTGFGLIWFAAGWSWRGVVATLLLLAAICSTASASDCYVAPVRQRVVQHYAQKVYAAPVVALQAYPVQYAYSVGQSYTEAALVAAVRADLRAEQQQLLQQQYELQREQLRNLIREELRQPQSVPPRATSGAPGSESNPAGSADGSQPDASGQAARIGRAVLEAKCVMCHMASSRDIAREVGPPLFRDDGKVMDWSKQQVQRIYDATHAGSMPKAPLPELNDDEFLAVTQYLQTLGLEPRAKREED